MWMPFEVPIMWMWLSLHSPSKSARYYRRRPVPAFSFECKAGALRKRWLFFTFNILFGYIVKVIFVRCICFSMSSTCDGCGNLLAPATVTVANSCQRAGIGQRGQRGADASCERRTEKSPLPRMACPGASWNYTIFCDPTSFVPSGQIWKPVGNQTI